MGGRKGRRRSKERTIKVFNKQKRHGRSKDMVIKNVYLRILLLPLALISWTIQAFIFGCMGIAGSVLAIFALIAKVIYDDELDGDMLFVFLIGWWAWYPWLWWYGYFRYGKIGVLDEFKEI